MFLRSLLKFRVILIVFTLLNPNMTTKLSYRPPMLSEGGLNFKNSFYEKSNILVSNYNIQYQIMNSVSMCGVLIIKRSLNTPFIFFCLLFSSVGVSLARPQL